MIQEETVQMLRSAFELEKAGIVVDEATVSKDNSFIAHGKWHNTNIKVYHTTPHTIQVVINNFIISTTSTDGTAEGLIKALKQALNTETAQKLRNRANANGSN